MLLDAHASHFAQAMRDGKGELIEDDDFDLDQIIADLERNDGEPLIDSNPDDWEVIDSWNATDTLLP